MTSRPRALVVGASIAGPAAAYWLTRAGYDVVVQERAPGPRPGGQNVDVRGAAREVLRRMGLEEAVRARNTGEVGTRFVDETGAAVAELPVVEGDAGGPTAELEILRGALAEVLAGGCPDAVTWRYDDHVVALDQDGDGVDVRLASGAAERYDLVVVADGVRSHTRGLLLDEEEVELDHLGMSIAFGTIARTDADDDWWRWLNTPGSRQVQLRPDDEGTIRASLAFLSDESALAGRTTDEVRADLRRRFADVGWETGRVLDGFDADDALYADDLAMARCTTWWRGRVCLLGDAAWCVTPIGGGGTSLALVGAYVLGAMLDRHDEVEVALAAYEEWMRPMVERAQHLPPGVPRLAAPHSRLGVSVLRQAMKLAASGPVQTVAGAIPIAEPHRDLPEPAGGTGREA
ncbi:FAD-dependent monooxygenase [Marmoricola endophyticus]|uniref:FAD-dependent monooxygenase n=1 Tax=Marmoricola endophyticus TaxID=2040280 RepID=UPI001E5AB4AF|nr:FAD-dependent monooxygenase [Marmoricola endophyticus]